MKKYRSLALICAFALTLTGCKAQSTVSEDSGAAAVSTVETEDKALDNADQTTASTAASESDPTTEDATTEASDENEITEPVISDSMTLSDYIVGNDSIAVTFRAPEGLDFSNEHSSIEELTLYECYGYTEDYTIGVMQVDFNYTLGKPQELLDYLGFGDSLYNIKTEFSAAVTDSGTKFDLVELSLYNDENMEELSSTGVMGCYPMENGVLFFGYEITGEVYSNTAMETLGSVNLFECKNAPSGTEIINQSDVTPDFSITMPCEYDVQPYEQEYLEAGTNPDYCSILYAECVDTVVMAHSWKGDDAWQYALDSMDASAYPDTVGLKYDYKLSDDVYISLQYDNDVIIYASGTYKVSDNEFVLVTVTPGYELNTEYIFSLMGLELLDGTPDAELPETFQTIICEEYNCTFPVLKEFEYWEDGDDTTIWSGMTTDDMNAVMVGYEADVYYKDIYEEFTYETDTQQGYTALSSDYMQTSDGKDFGFAEMALYSTEGTWDFTCLYAIYEADGGSYIIGYTFMGECDAETKGLIIESFKGFRISE